ncbi:hypothetical protein DPMN_034243 [Dreissena polymorpha]|uniref:Uncharacterized protein n=1 Tax=Dreissena polymorpha TaxID=45954 RepID=A0A9D4RJW8_DREPO|nr:hypothetical protein DPMN_034243 [Dreissena polymorpha]
MKALCHQHICKLYQVIETTDRFYMILEVSTVRQPDSAGIAISLNVMFFKGKSM